MKYIIFALILFSIVCSCNIVTGDITFTIEGPQKSFVYSIYNSRSVYHGEVELPYSYSYYEINNSIYKLIIKTSNDALITVYIDGIYYGEAIGRFEY